MKFVSSNNMVRMHPRVQSETKIIPYFDTVYSHNRSFDALICMFAHLEGSTWGSYPPSHMNGSCPRKNESPLRNAAGFSKQKS